MADEDKEDKKEVDGEDDESASKKGGKKLLIIIAAVVLLLVGGVAAAYFLGFLDPVVEMVTGEGGETLEEEEEEDPEAPKETVFYDLQEMLVNFNSGEGKSRFLKIRVSLELESQTAIKKIEKIMPRVVDSFQTYLRELRVGDLKGSAGLYRLREELLIRASAAAAPVKINDVLFKEILIQ